MKTVQWAVWQHTDTDTIQNIITPSSLKSLSIGSSKTLRPCPVTPGPSLTGAWRGEMGSRWTRWKLPSSGPTMAKPTCSAVASSGGLMRVKRGKGCTFSRSQVTLGITACGPECRPIWMTSSAGAKVTFRSTSVSWFFWHYCRILPHIRPHLTVAVIFRRCLLLQGQLLLGAEKWRTEPRGCDSSIHRCGLVKMSRDTCRANSSRSSFPKAV